MQPPTVGMRFTIAAAIPTAAPPRSIDCPFSGMRELVISLDCCRVARRAGIRCRRLAYTERPTVEGHLRESHVGSLSRRRDADRATSAEKKPSEALEHLPSQAPPSKKFGQGPAEKVTGGQSEGG